MSYCIVWADKYHEGPLSGLCLDKDKRWYWFNCSNLEEAIMARSDTPPSKREFKLYHLEGSELELAQVDYRRFNRNVGSFMNYGPEPRSPMRFFKREKRENVEEPEEDPQEDLYDATFFSTKFKIPSDRQPDDQINGSDFEEFYPSRTWKQKEEIPPIEELSLKQLDSSFTESSPIKEESSPNYEES